MSKASMSLRLSGWEIIIKSVNSARVRELCQRVMDIVLRGVIGMITLRGWHCPGRSGHRLQSSWKRCALKKRWNGWRRGIERSGDRGLRPSAAMAEETSILRQYLISWIGFKVL
jgi:hypothetical protein